MKCTFTVHSSDSSEFCFYNQSGTKSDNEDTSLVIELESSISAAPLVFWVVPLFKDDKVV